MDVGCDGNKLEPTSLEDRLNIMAKQPINKLHLIKTHMDHISTHPVKKSDLGFHGNLFGGTLLKWIDGGAAGYAMQLCDTPRMVTVSIDKCYFQRPAKESQLLKIYGFPTAVGNTSVTLYIEARAHNVYTGNQSVLLQTHIKFVQIDEEGTAIPIGDKGKMRIRRLIETAVSGIG
jgi:acyl-CoA thioesterase YciA